MLSNQYLKLKTFETIFEQHRIKWHGAIRVNRNCIVGLV